MTTEKIMLSLIRAEICAGTDGEEVAALCSETLDALYLLAQRYDLAHIVGKALQKAGALDGDETGKRFQQAEMQAFFRHTQLSYVYDEVCSVLERLQIGYIPLKGAVLRKYYPEPWLRTSGDIDILVKESDLDQAVDALVGEYGYKKEIKGSHDVSLFSPSGVHLELHYDLIEQKDAQKQRQILSRVWEMADAPENGSSRYELQDRLFYFYHIAHMAKHIYSGGCGIRPFLDMWILNHCVPHDGEARSALLREGGLLTFAQVAQALSEAWFSGLETDDSRVYSLERFVFQGRVYGSLENMVTMRQIQQGSKLKYALHKILPPYDVIKYHYPILWKHKWLTPFFQVIRWFKLLFQGKMKRSVRELKANANVSQEQIAFAADLLKQLEL